MVEVEHMRSWPTRKVETNEECPNCGATIHHREIGYALTKTEPVTWLVSGRFCSVGCVLDEQGPAEG